MRSYLLFFVNVYLMVNFSGCFRPVTVQDYVVNSRQNLLARFKTKDWLKCIVKCHNRSKCLSYNYRHRHRRRKGPLCELYTCGLDPTKDSIRSLYYSSGMIFQQLKVAKDGQYCKFKTSSSDQTCRSGWTPHGGSCYKAVNRNVSWNDANSNCQTMSSHLTSVSSQDQNDFVVSLSTKLSRSYFWVGFVRGNSTIPFKWQDGSLPNYDNWGSAEPSHIELYDCVNIRRSDGKWKNWACSETNPFICKYDRLDQTE